MNRPMECRDCDCRQAFYDGLGEALPPDPSTACICRHSFETHVYRTEAAL